MAIIARKVHVVTFGVHYKIVPFADAITVWVHQSALKKASILQSLCKYHNGSDTGVAPKIQMHNPHDPFGSIRADKVGASRVFRVLFGGDRQVWLLYLLSDIALPDQGNTFLRVFIESISGSGSF